MIVTDMAVETLVPYARNPRNNTAAPSRSSDGTASFRWTTPRASNVSSGWPRSTCEFCKRSA